MPDVEKVIHELEQCLDDSIAAVVPADTVRDALALLKAQEPVVMAGAELTDAEVIDAIRKAPITLKPAVDAIPMEWMREKMRGYASSLKSTETAALVMVMQMWQKEQEER